MAKPKKDTTEERKENLKKKIEQARKASPSGTLGPATGKAGAKGSRQTRTGISLSDPTGGPTIVVREDTRKAEVVPTKAIQKGKVVKGTTSQEFQAKIYRSKLCCCLVSYFPQIFCGTFSDLIGAISLKLLELALLNKYAKSYLT